jgi:hypothetical protein
MDLILNCISDYIKDSNKINEHPYFFLPEKYEVISHSRKKIRSYIRCMLRKNPNVLEFTVILNIFKDHPNHIGKYRITTKNEKTITFTLEFVDAKFNFNYWHIFLN